MHVVITDDNVPVYVGSTGNLRRRLREHLQGDRQASVLHEQVGAELDADGGTASAAEIATRLGQCSVIWMLTADPRQLKAQLVAHLRPRFNRTREQPTTGLVAVMSDVSAVNWDPVLHWSVRFAGSLDLDETERAYKLTIAAKLTEAVEGLGAGAPDWPQLLRRAFGSPNNLTSFHTHGRFLDWVDQHQDQAQELLRALWSQ